jgi:regulator of sigma E protease
MYSTLIGLLGIVLLFGVAVAIHEFGHFFAAKLFGVRVERFSIGMGPVIASFQWGETEYALSAFPVGGYVKLTGPVSEELESEGEVLDAEDEVKRLERLLEQHADVRARGRSGFLTAMAVALGLGLVSFVQQSAEAALAVALIGVLVGAVAAWKRLKFHRQLDALRPAEVEKELATARERVAALRTQHGSDAQEARLEAAVPGITQMSADEERLTSSLIEDNLALRSKPFYAKFLIFVAGCTMNVLLAFAVLVGMNWIGVDVTMPAGTDVEAPTAGSPLAAYDVRERDEILAIDGEAVGDWREVMMRLSEAAIEERSAVVTLRRPASADAPIEGTPRALVFDLELPWAPADEITGTMPDDTPDMERSRYTGAPYLHFSPFDPVAVAETVHNQPAERGGLEIDDRIVAIDGRPIETWSHLLAAVENHPDEELTFEVERGGERITLKITPLPDKAGKGRVGLLRNYSVTVRERDSFGGAVVNAYHGVIGRSVAFVEGFAMLLSGQIARPLEQLGGPLSIGYMAARKANEGLQRYLGFFVMINIILAIMNLLPVPLLDGGHIAFSAIEALIRRPIPARVLLTVYNVSFTFIIGLAVFLIGNDIYQNSWRYFDWVGRLVDMTVAG